MASMIEHTIQTATTEPTPSVDDFSCPICLAGPLVDPVTAPCGHSFDKACFASCLRKSGAVNCPVCRSPIPHCSLMVSVFLRDAMARLFPAELRNRQESMMYEELQDGHASDEVLACLIKRLKAAKDSDSIDMGSLLLMLTLFTEAVIGGGDASGQVGVLRTLRELNNTTWDLLQTSDMSHLSSILTTLVASMASLVEHASTTDVLTAWELDSLAATAVQGCMCVWSVPSQNVDAQIVRFQVAASILECFATASGPQRRLRGDTTTGMAGMLLAFWCESRKFDACDHSRNADTVDVRIIIIHTVGVLATLRGTAKLECVWADLQEQLMVALQSDEDFSVASSAAQTCGIFLDVELCPPQALLQWLPGLVSGTHTRLCSPEALSKPCQSRHILALMGDIHRAVPCQATDVIHSIVGAGKFDVTCRLLVSAGRVAMGLAFAVPVDCLLLASGILEAWEGILFFLCEIPTVDVEIGFLPWIDPLLSFLSDIFAIIVSDASKLPLLMDVIVLLLKLAAMSGGQIEATIVPKMRQQQKMLDAFMSHVSCPKAQHLIEKLGLLDKQETLSKHVETDGVCFGGRHAEESGSAGSRREGAGAVSRRKKVYAKRNAASRSSQTPNVEEVD